MVFLALPSTKKDAPTYFSIYARIRHNGNNKKYATGFKVIESEWLEYKSGNFKPSRMMESTNITFGQFDKILNKIKETMDESFDPDTAAETIKNIRETGVFKKVKREKICKRKVYTFSSYIEHHVELLKTGKKLKYKKSIKVTDAYVRAVNTIYNRVIQFEAENGILYFDDINMAFQRKFIEWCNKKNYSENTIAEFFSTIRYIMKTAYNSKLTKATEYMNPDFVPARVEPEEVFLDPGQIQEMMDYDTTSPEAIASIKSVYLKTVGRETIGDKHLKKIIDGINKTRDIFITGCLTGQRYSDFHRFHTDMICTMNGIKFLKFRQKKTDKEVYIPLDKRVEQILNKYNGQMPRLSLITFGRNLHILCEAMGWTWEPDLKSSKYHVGKRFCDLISTHAARRSFATNAYAAGIPLASIMAVTGHSREEHLRRYLKLDAQEKAKIAAKNMKGFIQSNRNQPLDGEMTNP